MAEKEERILCIETYEKIAECGYGDFYNTITRKEAICKIARAICRAGGNECIGDCESCDLWEVGPEKDYAEAALDSLLEGK